MPLARQMPLSWVALLVCITWLATPVAAFGAGNIASISRIEGINWRHGDIEDMLKTVACLHGHKWTSMMVKRVYFGNWLRDYSQAMDVGSLKSVQAESVRILVWILSFLTFGYATEEFEVTSERLGVYRPEEHIDNPKDYADNEDARKYDPRLRAPVQEIELEIDPRTGMKNYIANDDIGIATSIGYVKHSLSRSIHFGRMYTHGAGHSGKEADLCEALRCLGQSLHCLEDFGAHTNYCELALRELGHKLVFPHTGYETEMNLQGKRVYPIVTGTFGMVDFIHSVLGEATDHFTQTEVDDLNKALANAETHESSREGGASGAGLSHLTGLLSQVPGTSGLAREAEELQAQSAEQQRLNEMARAEAGAPGQTPSAAVVPVQPSDGNPHATIPGMSANFDPVATAKKIYPILEFRDKIAKAISATIEKIPGLEALVEKLTETVTLFVLSLLAPFIRPIIAAVSKSMKSGSSGVVESSGKHQYEPWTNPRCTDPTHSLLSKDHFSNILNEPAGQVAAAILQYVAPRVIYAWEHPDVPVEQVLNDVTRAFHHPAIRDQHCELHRNMFEVVKRWSHSTRHNIDSMLSADSVREGKNHLEVEHQHTNPHNLGAFSGGEGPGGIQLPNTNKLGELLSQAASSRFGSGTVNKLGRLGKASGLTRGGDDLDLEAEAAHPNPDYSRDAGGYESHRPPPGTGQDSYGQASPQPPQQRPEYYGYGQPPAPGQYSGGYLGGAPPGYYGQQSAPGEMPPQGYGYNYGGPPGGSYGQY